ATFARWQRELGYAAALRTSARAGHSEHQLGTTVDLRAAGSTTSSFSAFGRTKSGRWVAKHAWKYGFVMSYPEGQTDKTCYKFESRHRYSRRVRPDLRTALAVFLPTYRKCHDSSL